MPTNKNVEGAIGGTGGGGGGGGRGGGGSGSGGRGSRGVSASTRWFGTQSEPTKRGTATIVGGGVGAFGVAIKAISDYSWNQTKYGLDPLNDQKHVKKLYKWKTASPSPSPSRSAKPKASPSSSPSRSVKPAVKKPIQQKKSKGK